VEQSALELLRKVVDLAARSFDLAAVEVGFFEGRLIWWSHRKTASHAAGSGRWTSLSAQHPTAATPDWGGQTSWGRERTHLRCAAAIGLVIRAPHGAEGIKPRRENRGRRRSSILASDAWSRGFSVRALVFLTDEGFFLPTTVFEPSRPQAVLLV
jgi:hypothetical protein